MEQNNQHLHLIHLPSKKLLLALAFFLVFSSGASAQSPSPPAQPGHIVSPSFCSCADSDSTNSELKTTSTMLPSQIDIRTPYYPNTFHQDQNDVLEASASVTVDGNFPWDMFLPTITANNCPGWKTNSGGQVYNFDEIIRIGDDIEFNENHTEKFCISSAYSPTYTATFTIPTGCRYSEVKLQYWATGVSRANEILINNKLVDTTCDTDNATSLCCTRGEINITDVVHNGENQLEIKTLLFPGDNITPYDDIEIYRLHIELVR